MSQKQNVVKPGIKISADGLGLAITKFDGASNLGPDYTDCVPAIEPCGEDVFELWFHAEGHQSVCVLGNASAFIKLGRALTHLVDPRSFGDSKDE